MQKQKQITKANSKSDDFLEDRRLRMATELAVKERRAEIYAELYKLEYSEILEEWRTPSAMTLADLKRVTELKIEAQIIDNLMIRTQKFFQKLGGEITIEIRHSNEPNKVQNSFKVQS